MIDRLFRACISPPRGYRVRLAVATIITCAIFATATGIVGAVVTLMGLLKCFRRCSAGYNVKVTAGDHGGRLPRHPDPASVLLIVVRRDRRRVGREAYAGAFPLHARGLYIGYVIVLAKWKPRAHASASRKRAARGASTFGTEIGAAKSQRIDRAVARTYGRR